MKWQADREKIWRRISARLLDHSPEPDLRILVLAAHPDDETIGVSLLLSRSPNSAVAFLTDGAPRDTKLWPHVMNSREEYAEIRRKEAVAALSIAGISAEAICWLGGVDQEAVYEIDRLARELEKLLTKTHVDVVITHPYEGGHPDHDAAALVARIAVALKEENPPALVEMTSYHARASQCVTGEFLNSDKSPQLSFELSNGDRERKQRMIDAYASQRLVLGNFPIAREPLRLAPEYDFSKPPHEGKLWYECMGWMAGTHWRELASPAIGKYQEHACQ
jgi:N-acetylglucosamine malate deacetylase 2